MNYTPNIQGRDDTPFDKIEILELVESAWATEIIKNIYHESILVEYELHADEIQNFIDLWNDLPKSEMYRCHLPAYAVRTWHNNTVNFVASICWQCNNIFVAGSASLDDGVSFDGSSQQAQKLLSIFKDYFS